MSHEIESMAFAGNTPWHGLGHPVNSEMTADEMLVAAKLDWTVSKRPMYFQKELDGTSMRKAHGSYALVRDTDLSILSVTGENYKPIQNSEALGFFKDFVDAGQMKMETAGSLKGGKFVWALAKLEGNIDVGTKGNDQVNNYLLLSSPHQIGNRFVAQYTPIRVVCWNTLNFALGRGLKGNNNGFYMTHARAFDNDAKKAAEQTLGLVNSQITEFREISNRLAETRLAESRQREFFFEVMEVEDNIEEDEDQKDPRLLRKFEQALLEAPGASLDTSRGTLWGGVNAFTFLADHMMGRERDTALANSWFGSAAATKRRALNVAIDWAKAA